MDNRGAHTASKLGLSFVSLADSHLLDHLGLARGGAGESRRRGASLLLEDLPELEGLVRGGSGEHLSVRAEAAVENTGLVGWDLDVADESWVAPDAERVVGEATGADDLAVVRAPAKRGDLGAGVNAVDAGTGGGVPEVNVTVVGSAAGGEKVGLPWAPADGLDGSLVVGLGELGNREGASIPDRDEVVVAAGSELGTIGTPLETADLGGVGDELSCLVLGNAHVMVEDEAAASTGGEGVLVPSHNTNTGVVSVHAAELGALLNVPDLDLTRAESNADVCSVTGPLDAADIGVGASLEKRADGAGLCGPHVNVALEANSDLVVGAPVKEVEVVVID
ncbi:hypothetical protein O988_05932, partial [Pseudogymnoascus sp. VKM F-3808]